MPKVRKRIIVKKPGGYGALSFDETPLEDPGAGEIQVDVKVCGINFADISVRLGLYGAAHWNGPGQAYFPWLLCAAFMRSFMKPAHPPALDESVRLNTGRLIIGALCLALLVLCFVPAPITITFWSGAADAV